MKPGLPLMIGLALNLPPAAALAAEPSNDQLAEALLAFEPQGPGGPVRHIRCTDLQEQETRLACFYERRSPSGGWNRWATTVVLRDSRWRVVQAPGPVSKGGRN